MLPSLHPPSFLAEPLARDGATGSAPASSAAGLCSARGPHLSPMAVEKAGAQEYLISPGDVVEVIVWQNADLSREVTVRRMASCRCR